LSAMSEPIRRRAARILIAQIVVVAITALVAWYWKGHLSALAAISGGAVSFLLLLMLRLTMQKAAEQAVEDPRSSQLTMYMGAGVRFVLLLVLFAIGLGVLGLDPIWMIAGYIATQAAGVLAAQGNGGRPDIPEFSKK